MNNVSSALVYEHTHLRNAGAIKFDKKQIESFTETWFEAKAPVKANKLTQKLKENDRLRQVAANPLLLALLCLVFEETSEFPSNRSQLYKEGLEILLKQGNLLDDVGQDQVYKKLSLQQKKDLLSYIALKSFERGHYFFKQNELEQYITSYISNLSSTQRSSGSSGEHNLDTLYLDGEAVLRSILAHHGLLVEREPGVYSFCDLTLHEYFTAREIMNTSNPQALKEALQKLAERVTETHWREIFLLAVGMLRNADYLLSLMKCQIDALVSSNKELQHFLVWSSQESSLSVSYKPSALRAITIECVLNVDFKFARSLDTHLAYDLNCNSSLIYSYTCRLQKYQFTQQQKQILKQYYNANELLIDCLNNAHYVTRTVRKEIEETLLVPSSNSFKFN